MIKIGFKKLSQHAVAPSKGKPGDAAWDLCALHGTSVGRLQTVHTGIAVVIPDGYCGILMGRSGLASKGLYPVGFSLEVSRDGDGVNRNYGGMIDRTYRGELRVIMSYLDPGMDQEGAVPERYFIKAGERIAQLLVIPCPDSEMTEIIGDLPPSVRGTDGFGSTERDLLAKVNAGPFHTVESITANFTPEEWERVESLKEHIRANFGIPNPNLPSPPIWGRSPLRSLYPIWRANKLASINPVLSSDVMDALRGINPETPPVVTGKAQVTFGGGESPDLNHLESPLHHGAKLGEFAADWGKDYREPHEKPPAETFPPRTGYEADGLTANVKDVAERAAKMLLDELESDTLVLDLPFLSERNVKLIGQRIAFAILDYKSKTPGGAS